MINVPVKNVKAYQKEMLAFFADKYSDIVEEINKKGQLPDELTERILAAADEFGAEYAEAHKTKNA